MKKNIAAVLLSIAVATSSFAAAPARPAAPRPNRPDLIQKAKQLAKKLIKVISMDDDVPEIKPTITIP